MKQLALLRFWKRLIRKMKWYDIALLKVSVFFFTLFLITSWPAFRDYVFGFEWYWYLLIFVIVSIPLFKKVNELM